MILVLRKGITEKEIEQLKKVLRLGRLSHQRNQGSGGDYPRHCGDGQRGLAIF